ncbi:MAG TPA: EAL domain-containing protein [Vicinamibacteria bacterium]|nr:EAL domain-containing protein [Vicinamibacteria bacterium]
MALPLLPLLRSAEDPATEAIPTPRRRALLAGLDGAPRREAAASLAAAGFDVVTVEDVAGALERLTPPRPSVVLADPTLRDERGRSLCEVVRRHAEGADVPFLALCSGPRDAAMAIEAGASDVVEASFGGRVAARRAERLVRLAETTGDLGRVREEVARLRTALEDERRQALWRGRFDTLTSLPGPERLERALESALVGASAKSQVAVALLDIEHLVKLNTRLGRARANSVLQQVAQRLTAVLRSEELRRSGAGPSLSMAARFGGGLFAVLLTGLPGGPEAKAVARLLLDRLSGRYFAGDEEIVVSMSVGIALAPADGLTAEALLQKAELAAHEAVESGGAIRFYRQSADRMTERSRAIARLLPNALARGELRLDYQPLVAGASPCVRAAEALLRWASPELGDVPPSEFVPLAEEEGLMLAIGSWVLRTACRQVESWRRQGLPACRVAVNVSLCQLGRGDLARAVRESLEETGIEAESLELELSERGVLRSDPEILAQLNAIQALGVRLAIDDFGTGNSAVAYLKQFPIDVLKIDQSFVRGVTTSSEDAAITSATIAMARQLGLRVVAEGVEEAGQVEFLGRHGCDEYQGFLFSPAVPPGTFAEMLRCGLGRTLES